MKSKVLAFLGGMLLFFLFSPLLVQADCVSLKVYTSWIPQGDHRDQPSTGGVRPWGSDAARLSRLFQLDHCPGQDLRV